MLLLVKIKYIRSMENKTIILSVETANAVLQYLASKPYGEVYQLIALMRKDAAEGVGTPAENGGEVQKQDAEKQGKED